MHVSSLLKMQDRKIKKLLSSVLGQEKKNEDPQNKLADVKIAADMHIFGFARCKLAKAREHYP